MIHSTERKSGRITKNPLQPLVTVEEIQAFDPERPETFTPSPLINKILASITEIGPANCNDMAKYFGVAPRKLAGAIEIITGMNYQKLRETWARHKVETLKHQHPDWSGDKLAKAAGYADHSALWRADHRQLRKKEYMKSKEHRMKWLEEDRKRRWEEYLKKSKRNNETDTSMENLTTKQE